MATVGFERGGGDKCVSGCLSESPVCDLIPKLSYRLFSSRRFLLFWSSGRAFEGSESVMGGELAVAEDCVWTGMGEEDGGLG